MKYLILFTLLVSSSFAGQSIRKIHSCDTKGKVLNIFMVDDSWEIDKVLKTRVSECKVDFADKLYSAKCYNKYDNKNNKQVFNVKWSDKYDFHLKLIGEWQPDKGVIELRFEGDLKMEVPVDCSQN